MTVDEVIYGTTVSIQHKEFVEDWGHPNEPEKQYWLRRELPYFFNQIEFDKDGNALLTQQQEEYATEEVKRCRNGFSFYSNGKIVTITGKHYFYIQWWKLENDIYPDYRDTDRRYFHYLNHWENVSWCLGIIRGKKRREGASSQATANLIYECIFFKNSKCGLTSKTNIDAKKAFTDMASFGYRQLPVFLKPKQLNNKDSVSELVFAHKTVTLKGDVGGAIDNDTGHRSRLDFRAPSKNSYDSGRITRLLADEGGKWEKENPFSEFVKIVSKTLVQGAKRVGFAEFPSTVNEMTKSGGDEFKKVWNNATFKDDTRTVNRLVRYFSPAYDGYVGFIDKYGMSVIEPPTKEQYEYLIKNLGDGDLREDDIKLGAKQYLKNVRLPMSGTDLEEEIRMNPFDEDEMFMYAGQGCEFNSVNIQKQIKDLEEEPPYWRKMRLVEKKEKVPNQYPDQPKIEKRSISPMDDEKGGWLILEYPNKENHFEVYGNNILSPLNKNLYQIGVDTTQDRVAVAGSNPAIIVFKKSCMVTIGDERVETGLYPVAIWDNPTRMDIHFDEEVLKAAMWYGCTAAYEIDRRNDFVRFFRSRDCSDFLEWTPKIMMNPLKPNKPKEPGQRSGDPFQLAQMLQISKWYVDGDSMNEYNGHVHRIKYIPLLQQLLKYDHLDRTKSDLVVALQMALCAVFGEMQSPVKPAEVVRLFPQYKLKAYF